MQAYFMEQGIFLLRLLGASICGGIIGYERESRLKIAGIRTHTIVSLASALMMILSKYAFYDVLSDTIRLNPSRIAAGVVTAIGFLGASVIFTRNMNVSGLTTAAGIWATVGIGMAFGAGMYIMGVASTLIILLMQYIFHRNLKIVKSPAIEQITIHIQEDQDVNSLLDRAFTSREIKISNMKATRVGGQMLELKLFVRFPINYEVEDVIGLLKDIPEIASIDI